MPSKRLGRRVLMLKRNGSQRNLGGQCFPAQKSPGLLELGHAKRPSEQDLISSQSIYRLHSQEAQIQLLTTWLPHHCYSPPSSQFQLLEKYTRRAI